MLVLKAVFLGQRDIVFLLFLDMLHVKVGLAETNTGFSDGNNKKEKAK